MESKKKKKNKKIFPNIKNKKCKEVKIMKFAAIFS